MSDYEPRIIPRPPISVENHMAEGEYKKPKTGTRDNKGKLRWRNFPLYLIKPLIEVGQFGESKYATFNFLKGLPVLDTVDALKRHLEKFENPSELDIDPESQCHHLAHVAWNALVIIEHLKTHPDLDDRYKGES